MGRWIAIRAGTAIVAPSLRLPDTLPILHRNGCTSRCPIC